MSCAAHRRMATIRSSIAIQARPTSRGLVRKARASASASRAGKFASADSRSATTAAFCGRAPGLRSSKERNQRQRAGDVPQNAADQLPRHRGAVRGQLRHPKFLSPDASAEVGGCVGRYHHSLSAAARSRRITRVRPSRLAKIIHGRQSRLQLAAPLLEGTHAIGARCPHSEQNLPDTSCQSPVESPVDLVGTNGALSHPNSSEPCQPG